MWQISRLGLFDLVTILSFIPIAEYIVTKLLLYNTHVSTPLPVTILFPVGFAIARLINYADNLNYLSKASRYLHDLLSTKNLFVNLVYLGLCIICCLLATALWARRFIIGKLPSMIT